MLCFGVYDMLKNYEDNACEMTYMFQTPEYMVRNDYAMMSLPCYGNGCYWMKSTSGEHSEIDPIVVFFGFPEISKQVLCALQIYFLN